MDLSGIGSCAVLEVKIMNASRIIQSATNLRNEGSPMILIDDIGSSESSSESFRKFVPTTAYRLQCIHHAATLQLDTVFCGCQGRKCFWWWNNILRYTQVYKRLSWHVFLLSRHYTSCGIRLARNACSASTERV